MNLRRRQWLLVASVLFAYGCLIEWVWLRGQSLSGLLLLFFVTLPLLAVCFKSSQLSSTEIQDSPRPFQEFTAPPALDDLALAAAGFAATFVALKLALSDHLGWCLVSVLLAGICWRNLLDTRDDALPPKGKTALLALALIVAAAFRLYEAGNIPQGLITVDEPRLIVASQMILDGKRETFTSGATLADGSLPFYVQALGMKVFGETITGFRMGSIISGWLVVLLMAFVGGELAGASVGLAAAFITAMAYWPVSFSRAEYLVSASYLPMLSCIGLFLLGLRRSKPLALVLAGFSMGFCFNVYQPGKLVPLLLALLAGGLWLRHEKWRSALREAWPPLLAGLATGLAPLLLWIAHDPKAALQIYFLPFSTDFISGVRAAHEQNLLSRLDLMCGQILPQLNKVAGFFTVRGAIRSWFIGVNNTLIDKATLGLGLAGLAVCLARFKRPGYAFLPLWWLVGLLPTLMADTGANLDERRVMLSMPATMLLAGCGLVNLLELSSLGLATRARRNWMLAASLAFFAFYGFRNWKFYFNTINKNDDYLSINHANFDNTLRAVLRENYKSPVYLINTRKPQIDYWQGSTFLNELGEHTQILNHIPRLTAADDPDYIKNGGLFGALDGSMVGVSNKAYFNSPSFLGPAKGVGPKFDPLIVLTPFHFYLEPMLVSQLGGVRVAELAPAKGDKGVNLVDIGMYYDPAVATRIIRLPNFNPARLNSLRERWEYPYTVEELLPPGSMETRVSMANKEIYTPDAQAALRSYARDSSRWRSGRKSQFAMADPWFWMRAGSFPSSPKGEITFPLRLRASWSLKIPSDGVYSLGASANIYTSLRLDGKRIFLFIPESLQKNNDAREGLLGESVKLKAGIHRLDLEQVMLSTGGNYNHIVRLVWQRPDGQKETLPLEYLFPSTSAMKSPKK